MFKSEEGSFIVGYIAARMSKTGKVGFIGGIENDTLLSFMYGYMAGVDYANAEQGTHVECTSQWAESFSDASKGKSIAKKMAADNIDVIFVAAGGTGVGTIEGCDEEGIWAIGVDMDQSRLAPKTIITSALKRVDEAVYQVSKMIVDGEAEGGQTLALGVAEDAVGIAETHDLLPDETYEAALGVLDLIKAGDITVPATEEALADFVVSL
jgi:basic membrane protein A